MMLNYTTFLDAELGYVIILPVLSVCQQGCIGHSLSAAKVGK